MTSRIITALVAGAFWLLLLFLCPFPIFGVVFIFAGAIMGWEFVAATMPTEKPYVKAWAIFFCLIPIIASYAGRIDMLAASLFFTLLLLFIWIIFQFGKLEDPFTLLTRIAFGIILVGFFPAHLLLLMQMPEGPFLLLFISAITVASDSTAFFTGTFLGKRKLCPKVSPKKTIEGLIGGLLGASAAGVLVAFFFLSPNSYTKIIIFSCILGFIGIIGDLTESMLKRWSGVKDSGSIMPGHGGLLDRLDSLLLAAPAFYYLQRWHLIFS